MADASSIIKSRIVTCAFDVAKYVPGILCKNDNELSLAGTMSTTVLVNGKVWNGGSVLEYLKTLPAERWRRWSCFTMLRPTCTLRELS